MWEAKLGLEAEADAERERWALDSTLGPGVAGIMPYVLISTQIRMVSVRCRRMAGDVAPSPCLQPSPAGAVVPPS